METIDLYIIQDVDNTKIGESWILMTQSMYFTIMNNINLNYFLILFTIGCFSSLFCLNKNNNSHIHDNQDNYNYNYKTISTTEPLTINKSTSTVEATLIVEPTTKVEPIV